MISPDIEQLIRQAYSAWVTNDRRILEALLAEDFTFTSPRDDHLSRAEFWEVCWTHSDQIQSYDLLNVMVDQLEGFARYNCQLANGEHFRNTEYFRFNKQHKIVEIDVYFGRNLTSL